MSKKSGPFRVGVVGAGVFGAGFISQARRIPNLRISVVCDTDVEKTRAALEVMGFARDGIVNCDSKSAILRAIEQNSVAVISDSELFRDLPLDVMLEATGDPIFAAKVADIAISSGYGIAMATKETEVVIGPELAYRANRAGLRHLPVEGDQPALLIALVTRARMLGLPIVAAGKSTESDIVYNRDDETIHCWGKSMPAPGFGPLLDMGKDLRETLTQRGLSGALVATTPDLCEMTIVANYCGLAPSTPSLHAPIARPVELAKIFSPKEEGGILTNTGVVDVFGCLRRPEEISFAGGVFVTVDANDREAGALLASKGIPGSQNSRYLMLHNPVHLLGIEAIASVLAIAGETQTESAPPVEQSYDLVACATRDVAAGEVFALGERHEVDHVRAEIRPASALGPKNAVPYYLVAGSRAARAIKSGAHITGDDVLLDTKSPLLTIRQSQDARLFSSVRN